MGKKIYMCALSQESNSFNPQLTMMEVFENYNPYWGDGSVPKTFCHHSATGMYETLIDGDAEVICGPVIRAGSGGAVDHSVITRFLDIVLKQLETLKDIDGVGIVLHGATVSNRIEDVCGYILETVRNKVGELAVISAAFDLHANITEKVSENADFITGYQEYPHLDQKETGIRAAKRLLEKLEGKGGKVAVTLIPSIASAHGYTTFKGSLGKLTGYAKSLIEKGEIIDYTIFQVQPWLDVEEMASSVVVIAEDEKKAKEVASQLAYENFLIREELLGEKLFTIPEVVEKALNNKSGKPVILVDSSDSPNAGANADSAAVLEYLLPHRETLSCAVAVSDIPAVEKAIALGIGAIADFTLGATKAPLLSKPINVKDAVVVSIHNGEFYSFGPEDKGIKRDLGKTVVLKAGKIWIHVSSEGKFEGDLNFYRSFGIEPTECALVGVKACTSFRAGYEPIASEICNTDTPGAASGVLESLPFKKRPVPLYPFEEITEDNITEAKCYR